MKHLAPYQIFFPLGIFSALVAVGVWFIQGLHWLPTPPMLIHERLIVGGFLWSFIVGFLMTALPRMTGTDPATWIEKAIALGIILSAIVTGCHSDGTYFYLVEMGLVVFLLVFGGRRVIGAKKPVPVFVSHVGWAMIAAFLGALAHMKGNSFLGIHLYHVGAILLLVLGVGTRFFSFLSGLPSDFENRNNRLQRLLFHSAGFITLGLLYLAGTGIHAAYLGLTLVMLFYLFGIWRVPRLSNRPSALKYGVRIVATMIPLSFFLCFLWPAMFITWFHILFIGCFALMTFSVATRVTLAHGSYSLDLETKSKALWWFIGFMILALVSRVLYGLTDHEMMRKGFLHLAATAWTLAIVIWCVSFLIKIWCKGPTAKPSC